MQKLCSEKEFADSVIVFVEMLHYRQVRMWVLMKRRGLKGLKSSKGEQLILMMAALRL